MTSTEVAAPTQAASLYQRGAVIASSLSAIAVIVAFAQSIRFFLDLEASKGSTLGDWDLTLGVPSVAISISLFAIVLTASAARLAGARFARWFQVAIAIVMLLVIVFELVTTIARFEWYSLLLAILAVFVFAEWLRMMREPASVSSEGPRPLALGILLIVGGSFGWLAAFNLSVDKVNSIVSPTVAQSCDFSLIVQCSKNLGSAQGSAFGFPNPLIGLGGMVVPIIVGIAILAGARFARWFWIGLNIGILGALAFVIWLITVSIFILHTLCPWCMLVWTMVIPMFWGTTLSNFGRGVFGLSESARSRWRAISTYVPLISLLSYLVVAIIAQVQLDVIGHLL